MAQPIHGLFFAIRPPPAIAAEIGRWRDVSELVGKRVSDDRLHVTLFHCGDHRPLPEEMVTRAKLAASSVIQSPFRIVFDSLVGGAKTALLFPSEPIQGLMRFQQQLASALVQQGIKLRERRRFQPHVTLRHGPQRGFNRPIDPISWLAEDFVLIDSHIGKGLHEELARWRLEG